MWKFVTFMLCMMVILPLSFGGNILGLFPYPGKSHFSFFHTLSVGLASAGHNVTIVSYFPNEKSVENYTDLVLEGLPIKINDFNIESMQQTSFLFREVKFMRLFHLSKIGLSYCKTAFESKAIREVLESGTKYDVVLTEYFVNDCMLAISHKLNAPVVALISHALMPWHYRRMGSPFVSSFMPSLFLGHSYQMGFFERLNNLIQHGLMVLLYELLCQRPTNELIRKHFGNSMPGIEQLVFNTSAMLINQHPSLNGAMPYVPGIVEVGGLHIQQPKGLDPEIKRILDNAKNGVIYFSWGSLVRPETLTIEKKNILVKALSQLDQVVLLKWPNVSLPNSPSNFYIRDWMPQRDILCHPNVKVFMAHGGMLGTTEACYCGVPLVMTPFFGDQFLNAKTMEHLQIGVVLHYRDMEEKNIVKAIRTALSPSMQKRAKSVSEAYRNRPQEPLKLAIWWVEHIIHSRGSPLSVNASLRMSWVTFHNLDVYAVLLIIFILFSIGLKILMTRIYSALDVRIAKQKIL